MNPIYRCTIFWEGVHKFTRPSNLFIRASNENEAENSARATFQGIIDSTQTVDAEFRIEVSLCSEEELEEYVKQRRAGHKTNLAMN